LQSAELYLNQTMQKKFVVIILARGGSKGIKNKNLTKVNGKPLIYWTLKSCLNSKKIKSFWVSSDSKKILKYAKENRSNIIQRPKNLSTNTSTSESGWAHAINTLEKRNIKFDNVVVLQATSPVRRKNEIDIAISNFVKKKFDSMLSVYKSHVFFWKRRKKNLKASYNFKKRPLRQNLDDQYIENGSLYIFKKQKFKKIKNRLFGRIGLHIMSRNHSFEIDEKEDIKLISKFREFFGSK
tara:strand:- start:43 stop:759 length:717 start_codon:yes stop_codon:yes gene_type:complete